jgi:hypothetical protein
MKSKWSVSDTPCERVTWVFLAFSTEPYSHHSWFHIPIFRWIRVTLEGYCSVNTTSFVASRSLFAFYFSVVLIISHSDFIEADHLGRSALCHSPKKTRGVTGGWRFGGNQGFLSPFLARFLIWKTMIKHQLCWFFQDIFRQSHPGTTGTPKWVIFVTRWRALWDLQNPELRSTEVPVKSWK